MDKHFRRGTLVELTIDANTIPAGTYTCIDSSDELLLFSVDHEIVLGLARKFWSPFLSPARGEANHKTSRKDFLRRYSKLIRTTQRTHTTVPPHSLTFCVVSPRTQDHLLARHNHIEIKQSEMGGTTHASCEEAFALPL